MLFLHKIKIGIKLGFTGGLNQANYWIFIFKNWLNNNSLTFFSATIAAVNFRAVVSCVYRVKTEGAIASLK